MIDWRIYYGDGTTFDSSMGGPEDAPSDNVVCIAYDEKDNTRPEYIGRPVISGSDWYLYRKDIACWWRVDVFGVMDQVKHHLECVGAVVQGRYIPDKTFRELLDRARTEPGLPRKSAKRTSESSRQYYD